REIVGRRDGDGRRDRRLAGVLPQPLQENIYSERSPDGKKRSSRLPPGESPDHEVGVGRLAGVIEARTAIGKDPGEERGIAAAGPEVRRRAAPPAPDGCREKALDVDRVGAPLEAVERENARSPGRPFHVVEEDLV